jgi:hypothetical protein
VKIFGLQLEREHIGKQLTENRRDFINGIDAQIGGVVESLNTGTFLHLHKISS